MPIPVQCKIFISLDRFTWCETYYLISNSLTSALQTLYHVAEARTGLIGHDAAIAQLRVADETRYGSVLRTGIAPASVAARVKSARDGIEVRFSASQPGSSHFYHRESCLRGLRADIASPVTTFPVTFHQPGYSQLVSWLQLLIDQGFRLKVRDKEQPWHPVARLERFAEVEADALGDPLDPDSLPPSDSYLCVSSKDQDEIPLTDPQTGARSLVQLAGVGWNPRANLRRGQTNSTRPLLASYPGTIFLQGDVPSEGYAQPLGYYRLVRYAYVPLTDCLPVGRSSRLTGGRSRYCKPLAPPASPPSAGKEPTAPPEPPEPLPTPPGVPGGIPTSIIQNAQVLAQVCFEGYGPAPPAPGLPIGIAQVLNLPNTWLVVVSGTDIRQSQATGIPEDILAALGQPDLFATRIVNVVKQTIPPGQNLILAGHSLGGMEAQNVILPLLTLGYPTSNLITFGSPLTSLSGLGVTTARFRLHGDPTVDASPAGLALSAAGHPEQIFIQDPSIGTGWVVAHLGYPISAVVGAYNALGGFAAFAGPQSLELGPMQRFAVPRMLEAAEVVVLVEV